jgi:uncharacterized membrane protein
MSIGRLKDGVCVCVCVFVLPVIGYVTTAYYLWLEQGLFCNSLLQMGLGCLGGHINFILLRTLISGNCTNDIFVPVSAVYYFPKKI